MPDNDSANFPSLVSREQAGNAIGNALRLFVGRGRHFSVKQLYKGTGVAPRMIECAMASGYDHRPLPDWALLSISKFLGTDFVNEWFGLADLIASETADPCHDTLAADCIEFAAEHARARHPDSPAGVDIAPCEDKTLRRKRNAMGIAQ